MQQILSSFTTCGLRMWLTRFQGHWLSGHFWVIGSQLQIHTCYLLRFSQLGHTEIQGNQGFIMFWILMHNCSDPDLLYFDANEKLSPFLSTKHLILIFFSSANSSILFSLNSILGSIGISNFITLLFIVFCNQSLQFSTKKKKKKMI